MDTGVLVLAGVFALAAIFAVWNLAHRRSIERQLEARGFASCEGEAPAVEQGWRTITGAGAPDEITILRCRQRSTSRGTIYHFIVRVRSSRGGSDDTDGPGASHPAYLFDLRDPSAAGRSGVTLHILPPTSARVRKLIAGMAGRTDPRPQLEIGPHAWSPAIVAAFGDAAGRLDDVLPMATQEKLAKASAHGFFTVHLRGGHAALVANPAHRDVEAQLRFVNDWA
jgi:hypothetical protein